MVDLLAERIAKLSPEKRELLLQQLQKNKKPSGNTAAIPPRPEGQAPLALSFTQQRLWFLDQLEPGQTTYNICLAIHLRGPLQVSALEQSLTMLVARHEILRTTFETVAGQPSQRIQSPVPLNLELVDLSRLAPDLQTAELEQLTTAEISHSFDLAHGPLLRAKLLRLTAHQHRLLLTMHHIISDGWSLGIIYRELTAFYNATLSQTTVSLPELPIQFADFALWQRTWLSGQVLEKQLAYWQKQLAGASTALSLPTDHPRPAIQSHHGRQHKFSLSKALSNQLKRFSRQQGATLYMVLLAAFQTLLYRYTGQEDIVVGSPIANRSRVETENLIGFFANTLVLRTDLSGTPSFQELLKRVRQTVLGAQSHQDLPFERLIEVLQPDRDLSRNPLFQVMFILQNTPLVPLELHELSAEIEPIHTGTAKFDLTLALTDTETGLSGTLEYDLDLFEADTIARMIDHFEMILHGLVTHPTHPISEVPLLTTAEQQTLVSWNQTSAEFPAEATLPQLFEAQVARTPEAVAVTLGESQLTYNELNRSANHLAHYLQQQGVGPEVIVGICMERSLEMIIGLWAILKAGGAYVPLDPTYPTERLAFIIEDTQTPILLTQTKLLGALPGDKVKMLCLDANDAELDRAEVGNLAAGLQPDHLAYVIYTSGSTGTPKGVLVEHRSVINYLWWVNRTLLQDNPCQLPTLTQLTFDASLKQLFAPLLRGEAVWLLPEEAVLQPKLLLHELVQHSPAGLNSVPSLWGMILDEIEANPANLPAETLQGVYVGGEALTPELVTRTFNLLPNLTLWNLYGPTETTANATAAKIVPGEPITIGRPLANAQVFILDRHNQPVPVGIPGELHIGGAGVARGYLNRPELTAERFIENPFAQKSEPNAPRPDHTDNRLPSQVSSPKLYKTGDLARYRPDGTIEFLGRLDHQVKIRGFRIELEEIETVLTAHPQVRESLVIAHENELGQPQIVAYVVKNTNKAPNDRLVSEPHQNSNDNSTLIAEMRRYLTQKLPGYMIPNVFTVLDRFPLTATGKVDRHALPTLETIRLETNDVISARDAVELQLTKLWEQVLGVKPIGIDQNFFELGGHSMVMVRLLNQIESVFGQKIPLATLFQTPTISELAQVLRQKDSNVPVSPVVALQASGSKPPLFCVPGILGNVFLDLKDLVRHLDPDQPIYGLQDGPDNPTGIKALATRFVQEIRVIQPHGPYRLAGICFGGVIAFEMAQQLQSQHQDIEVLALIEPSPPPISSLKSYLDLAYNLTTRTLKRFSHHVDNFAQRDSVEQRAYLGWKRKLIGNMWARANYTVSPYSGPIALFVTKETLAQAHVNRSLEWRELAGGKVEVVEIPGTHNMITGADGTEISEPTMRALAERLGSRLNDLQIKRS
ncbi:MAG: amino acid adenylation domain-containing protein [Anaerolineae bacterium]|nr:amino acid adenylation domain-containing protein [Anaerolineae bacterium]